MNEYLLEILQPTEDAFAAAINDEEAGGSEFRRNTIQAVEGRITNLATFAELDPGNLPDKEARAQTFGTALPAGATIVWQGAAIIGGSNIAITVYR